VARLLSAITFGIEQDPDPALERIEPDPRVAFREGRKLVLAEVNRFLQSAAQDLARGTEFAAQAHLQGEAAWWSERTSG